MRGEEKRMMWFGVLFVLRCVLCVVWLAVILAPPAAASYSMN